MSRHVDIDRDAFEPIGAVADRVVADVRQRMADWLMHAKGNRRRAHDYKRWALEAEAAGNLSTYRHFRKQSDRSWKAAWDALASAKIYRDLAK
jgi:hypothetical protein